MSYGITEKEANEQFNGMVRMHCIGTLGLPEDIKYATKCAIKEV